LEWLWLMTMLRTSNHKGIKNNNEVLCVRYIRLLWISYFRERVIGCAKHADRPATIWQGACKGIQSLDMKE
jgi:hypothetical protein